MATLETTFAGLKLRNPIIVSSSGLTDSAAKNQKLSEAGAGAIVLKSLFEEQIMMEADWMGDPNMYPEGSDYLVGYIREHKLGEYLNLIKESKKVCNIPIIASINCYDKNEHTLDALVEKLLGRSEFTGTDPVDSFCGMMDTRI